MYEIVLTIHSWLRWLALIGGLVTTVLLITGRGGGATDRSSSWGRICMISLDLQLVLGLLLYFALSPTTIAILGNFGAAMRDPVARFWAVEHITTMVGAVVIVHVGMILSRKATTPASRRARLLICFGLATLLMIIGIPWPTTNAGRPLIRL